MRDEGHSGFSPRLTQSDYEMSTGFSLWLVFFRALHFCS